MAVPLPQAFPFLYQGHAAIVHPGMTSSLRIANIVNVAPRLLGSGKIRSSRLWKARRVAGHKMDVFTFSPVHPVLARRVEAADSGLFKKLLKHGIWDFPEAELVV
jgi:hypothetical protein